MISVFDRILLIERAQAKYGEISACDTCITLEDCFTESMSNVYFWFNDSSNSTHVEKDFL